MAQALVERWQALGGSIADSVTYSGREDYSASIKDALGIPASEQRAQAIKEIMGTNVEFNARRRQDIDVIFLLSGNAAEARSAQTAAGLPLRRLGAGLRCFQYLQRVYRPRDRDLDGINFVETPGCWAPMQS